MRYEPCRPRLAAIRAPMSEWHPRQRNSGWLLPDLVALGAVHGAVEKLVRLGQWAGRNLRDRTSRQRKKNHEQQDEENAGLQQPARRLLVVMRRQWMAPSFIWQ